VAIEEQQAEAALATKRQHVAQQNRTVPAQDDGEFAALENAANSVGQLTGVCGDRMRIQHPRGGIYVGAVRRRLDAPGMPRMQTSRQAGREKRVR
jgi:hypothetical protein